MSTSHSELVPSTVVQDVAGWPAGIDNPDELTELDPREPDDEATTVRPSVVPPDDPIVQSADAPERPSIGGFTATLRGKVGKYELQAKLGRGAFGVVFTARDPSLERDVAIKLLRPSHLTNPEIVHRFLQEARATARIGHPGIVTIHDCGHVETTAGTTAFIAMELLAGESLTARITRTDQFAPVAAVELARQVASALEAAHRANVLHRDLKPDNIYLVPDPAMPEGERIKVLDFGLAKLGEGGHTEAALVFGTPRYMSPEQCRSATQVDHRSDIYALGCILFELVTGRSPFEGDLRAMIEQHLRATAPRASSLVAGVTPALDNLLAEMLAKDPMHRPQTMGAVQRALVAALDDVPPPPPPPSQSPSPLHVPRPGSAPIAPFVTVTSALESLDAPASAIPPSGILILPAPGLAPGLPPNLAPMPLTTVPTPRPGWPRLLLGALCVVIGATGGAIAWLTLR